MSNTITSNNATSPTTPTSSSSSSTNPLMGAAPSESTFLTLLVTQLKNQDPMSPTDSTQFVGELAQFSSLEQLMTINQNIGTMTNVLAPISAGTTPASGTSQA